MRKKKKSIEDVSVDTLLDNLTDLDAPSESRPADDPWSEEYLAKLQRREAMITLEKHRREEAITQTSPEPRPDPPVVSEKMSQMRKCQDCYYCVGSRMVGGSWWCHCTNPGRSAECEVQTQSWVKSKLNLPCWRAPD